MQPITPVTPAQLLASGQQPKAKFEIYNHASWINLCNLHSPIDLVGWWAFDEGAGMTAYDHSKEENHGSLENMTEADWVDGKVGKALDFDGDDDFVNVPDDDSLDFGTTVDYSISAWVKKTDVSGVEIVTDKRTLEQIGFALYFIGDTLYFRGDGNGRDLVCTETFVADQWYHIVFVNDRTHARTFYINGVEKGTSIFDSTGVDITNATNLVIGREYSQAAYFFDGLIDEVRIYNRVLTASEIKALYELKGKNYLEDWSISLGGASMTPNPVGGTWGVTLSNENGIFHPKHPTSAYKDYLVTGRKVRLSIGGTYGGIDYYWQRIIGHMDEPSFDIAGAKINIRGGDYMKFLEDVELRSPNSLWRSSATFNSIASDGTTGSELYDEADAMDIDDDANNVTPWGASACTFVSVADATGGSSYVGKATCPVIDWSEIGNGNIFTPVAGTQYVFTFKYKRVSGFDRMQCFIKQGAIDLVSSQYLRKVDWTEVSMSFTAQNTDPIELYFYFDDFQTETEFRFDQFSIKEFIPYWERYYELPAACKGIYRVVLDDENVWQGEENEGWGYEESTRRVFFDINKEITGGTDNLVIHYFTTQALENMVADILVTAHLYADRAAALADMDYISPGVNIDQVWFKIGDPALGAIAMICERCDYRFHFSYAGKPVFKPKPTPGATDFTFTNQKHVGSIERYEDRAEILNRIVIEGKKQANPINREENLSSELRGEASDATSITAYGERTKTIKNPLFQTQASIDAMCTTLLAEYKDAKWYCSISIPYNPVPLEFSDDIQWKERLSPTLEITETGFVRDIKISKFDTTYKCETT